MTVVLGCRRCRRRSTSPRVIRLKKRHVSPQRKGPSLPANSFKRKTATGEDGHLWRSVADYRGVYRWRRITKS